VPGSHLSRITKLVPWHNAVTLRQYRQDALTLTTAVSFKIHTRSTFMIIFTESCGTAVSTPHSYFEGPGYKSRLGKLLSSLSLWLSSDTLANLHQNTRRYKAEESRRLWWNSSTPSLYWHSAVQRAEQRHDYGNASVDRSVTKLPTVPADVMKTVSMPSESSKLYFRLRCYSSNVCAWQTLDVSKNTTRVLPSLSQSLHLPPDGAGLTIGN
jgi:hypothetical protein